MPKGVQLYTSPNQEGSDLLLKTLSWVLLNFELQSILSQPAQPITLEIKSKLSEIGYTQEPLGSLCPQEIETLFKEGEFFSCTKTGNRIVAFVLKENGLNKETFNDIEATITNAYRKIKKLNGENTLLERSYAYTLETLAVFRP